MSALRSVSFLAVLLLVLPACDSGGEPVLPNEPMPESELGQQGEQVYRNRVDDGNSFTCATCHALVEPAADFRRPGHPLGDAAARGSYKNGRVAELREAVNSCLVEWMNAEPWSEDDERWIALSTFLDEIAPATAEPLTFTIAEPPSAAALTGGDPATGREVFNASCAVCHGQDGAGTERALPVGSRGLDPEYVALRTRRSGRVDSPVYDGLAGGVMPFWAADRLSDAELRDVVAWLAQDSGSAGSGDGDGDGDGDDGGLPSCGATHPKIGQTAVLEEYFHDVGGVAEIIDDCTIRITDFTYDAAGIDVRLYGGLGGDYDSGFGMGEDLVRSQPYLGETLDFRLPEGVTLDDLDGVSVWCVDVGVDFGSGTFG